MTTEEFFAKFPPIYVEVYSKLSPELKSDEFKLYERLLPYRDEIADLSLGQASTYVALKNLREGFKRIGNAAAQVKVALDKAFKGEQPDPKKAYTLSS